MKILNYLPKLTLACAAVALLSAATFNWSFLQPRTLAWDYPETNDLNLLSFNLYTTTNVTLPLTAWQKMTNVAATNLTLKQTIGATGPTNTFYFQFLQVPQLQFFVVTASNSFYGGESVFSNVTNTPTPPFSSRLNIQ